ncbi:MAG: glutamate--tRNA ligase, partial [Solirubrobacteraceae bacterium]
EDTDKERSTSENVQQIIDALNWLEIDWDEGPIFQSQRSERHRQALEQLLDSGHAYRCNATAEDVKFFKLTHGAERGFRGRVEEHGAVRLRVPDDGQTIVRDVIRGDTSFEHVHMDDPVIARADGSVLYNFAVAIDDLDAQITHVVRGEDHLSNTPKQLLVLQALEAPVPVYGHLPLLHGSDGAKLSKRHGAASVQELRDAGYLPAAVRNYLALLGWGSDDDQTVLSTQELIERFTLERVSHNPARFDEVKLRWLDGVHIRELSLKELTARMGEFAGVCQPELQQAIETDPQRVEAAVRISQEKIHTLADFWTLSGFFFHEPELDPDAAKRWLTGTHQSTLRRVRDALAQTADFCEQTIEEALAGVVEQLGVRVKDVYQPLRVAIAGRTISPGIFESVALLGREPTLARIDKALRVCQPA